MTRQPKKSYYPTYDVLNAKNEWDEATQRVIFNRLHINESGTLTPEMNRTVQALTGVLFPSHIGEQTLSIVMVLDQRIKQGHLKTYPKLASLSKEFIIKNGLTYVEEEAFFDYKKPFVLLEKQDRVNLVERLKLNKGNQQIWELTTSELFYQTISSELVKIIYSDPSIWSQIGYGGPAYPRGYYAFGPGQFDQWEAEPHD